LFPLFRLAQLRPRPKQRILAGAAAAVIVTGILAWLVSQQTAGEEGNGPPLPRLSSRGTQSQIQARITLRSAPWRLATGEGFVWALTRAPAPALWRIDPTSSEVVGEPTRLPVDPWDLAVGGGAVWVAPNGADGRLIRIDARSGRITARISARPIYFGSTVTLGGGYVWTGNDDERYMNGSTISRINPRSGRVIGKPIRVGSPQSLAFGGGALWDADHAGWIIKIDPKRVEVTARQRINFGPHGVVVTGNRVYVADAHGHRLLAVNPTTAAIEAVTKLPLGPIYPAFGEGAIWSGSEAAWQGEEDDRLVRIDPDTLAIVETLHLGANVITVSFGYGSAWAGLASGEIVRVRPPRRS
jgi:hypothetical protein